MSDRFDHTLERKLESSADDAPADAPSPVRRIELITGAGRRRRWSRAEKARILVESFEPDANVSEVARRNGLSPQQLFAWRREVRLLFEEESGTAARAEAPPSRRGKARTGPSPEVSDETLQFVPVVMTAAAPASPPPGCRAPPASSARIEIVIGTVVVRVVGAVEASVLAIVLAAVRRTA